MRKRVRICVLAILLPVVAVLAGNPCELTILYTNDIHAQVRPMKASWLEGEPEIGGFAHIDTLVKETRKTRDHGAVE